MKGKKIRLGYNLLKRGFCSKVANERIRFEFILTACFNFVSIRVGLLGVFMSYDGLLQNQQLFVRLCNSPSVNNLLAGIQRVQAPFPAFFGFQYLTSPP